MDNSHIQKFPALGSFILGGAVAVAFTVNSASALPPAKPQGKFVSANLKGFVIQDSHDVSITSAPGTIGPSHHYRFNTSGTVHGTGLLSSVLPAKSDLNETLDDLQSGAGSALRGAVFESVFGDTYPIVNQDINGGVGPISVTGRLESGVDQGIATFALKNFHFTVFGIPNTSSTIVFDDVFLVGMSQDIVRSDVNFDANSDIVLLDTKKKAVKLAYLNGTSYLAKTAAKSVVSALKGAKLPSGFEIVGISDFNLDGNMDLLLFNSKSRQTKALTMNLEKLKGSSVAASLLTGPTLPAGFKVGGTGDFNLDGTWDILAYNPSSLATQEIFLQKGMGLLGADLASSTQAGPSITKGFEVVSTIDYNDDGVADILQYNPKTQATSVILLGGAGGSPGTVNGPKIAKGWTLIGASGFDNNRTIDLLVYNKEQNKVAFHLNKGDTFATVAKKSSNTLTLPSGVVPVGPR